MREGKGQESGKEGLCLGTIWKTVLLYEKTGNDPLLSEVFIVN